MSKPLSVEDLMKPRWKCTSKYPDALWAIGAIIGNRFSPVFVTSSFEYDIGYYDNLFKPLEWWEEREMEDLPQYVKWTNSEGAFMRNATEWRVIRGDLHFNLDGKNDWAKIHKDDLPATRHEYEQYESTLTPKQ